MVITTVKPSGVAVVVPNSGFHAASTDVAVTVFEPTTYPVLVVVIVAVALVLAATPVTVTKPLPLTVAVPDVTVRAHV